MRTPCFALIALCLFATGAAGQPARLGPGVVADTLVGPALLGTSFGFDGGWRVTFGVGRIFR